MTNVTVLLSIIQTSSLTGYQSSRHAFQSMAQKRLHLRLLAISGTVVQASKNDGNDDKGQHAIKQTYI